MGAKFMREHPGYHKEWVKNNREKMRGYTRKWNANNPDYYKEWRMKNDGYSRRPYAADPEKVKMKYMAYIKKYPEKYRAGYLLRSAVRSGKVIRPDTCPCGNPNPHGHHPDYSKPLMVMWLCPKCHSALHYEMGKKMRPDDYQPQESEELEVKDAGKGF
jgi:hypothetical protein